MSSVTSDAIPIKSTTRTIRECFVSCLYVVPNFQRPYSWDIDELDDYWADVVLARGDFFFGSTVTWESESRELFNNTYSIIDGQQRLTTSAIMLSVIRDAFLAAVESEDGIGSGDLRSQARAQAERTQKYLMIEDDRGVQHPVLTRHEPNFQEVVLNPSAIPSHKRWNGSARQIGVAREYFERRVQEAVDSNSLAEVIKTLQGLRDNVLKARLIQVELTSEEDGFLIFETLNTRGADLRLADLVKNLLVRGSATKVEDRETVSRRWEQLTDRVQGEDGSTVNVDQFMWQSWNSRRPAVTEAELYKKIHEFVDGSAQRHLEYLGELEFDSIVYQYLDDVGLVIDKQALDPKSALRIPEVVEAIRALALFNVSVANSAILAVVRKYEKSGLMRKQDVIAACRAIESFHFQFTALTNSGSTGGTRGRYNRFAVELEEASSRQAVQGAIKSFQEKLEGSLPSPEEARASFEQLFYAPKVRLNNAQKRRSRKQFLSYVLLRLAQHHKTLPLGQDLSVWTIEHIRPQKLASAEVESPEYSIGNLALLTDAANNDLGDGDLAAKRAGLNRFVLWKDDQLSKWIDDNEKSEVQVRDIALRAKLLAVLAVDAVWSIR
ncbi:DUF262 domain-containing protein [Tessaracoccus palaemonis]|uniref:DUF262 domain-containing HNH endonuclease family protein n=1 Tax=Tessaracoccus palaemonis TaxID=2829499 RepID=A0ABX8SM85_9ACTN|nr:DUF262 domain-containing protein [Tessaracoccus palaemonis]QXT63745.1 DUF262 domain-containing HNH endonuclease family protein [Tessaracoccus palaemonis]